MRVKTLIATAAAIVVALTPLAQARAATNPPPPRTLQTPGIDAHLGYQPQKTCSPSAKPGTSALLRALLDTWGGVSWGISRFCSSGGTSEHKEGRAIDWRMDSRKAKDRKKVDQVIKWITGNNGEVAYRLGVMYIIWNQKIWSIYYQELGWRKMSDRGSWTANHKDHVHLSLSWDGAMAQTSWWTGKVLTVPQRGPCGTGNYGACLPRIGRSSSTTWPRVTVGPFTPYPSNVPNIAGSARVGLTLRAVPGTWPPAGSTLYYQWLRDGSAIPGATGDSYVVQAADVGKAIKLRVRATLEGATLTKTSDSTTDTVKGVFPTPRPQVSGTYRYGSSTLTGRPGAGFPSGTSFSYQWQRDSKNISGATSATYTLSLADVSADVRLRVRAAKSGWTTDYTYSVNTRVLGESFQTTVTPTISGIVRVGGELKANPGTWSPTASYSYRWYRDGTRISGATSATYVLTSADHKHTIKVRVTGNRLGYNTKHKYSAATTIVRQGITSFAPVIKDKTPRVGQELSITRGVWRPDGVSYRYKWYRDGAVIAGATSRRYTVVAADYGKRLRVRVIGTLDGYPTARRLSSRTAEVAAGTIRSSGVSVDGEPIVGGTLTAGGGTWADAADTVVQPELRYRWYADGKPIAGATAATFTPTAAERGRAVNVVVTATSPQYQAVRVRSTAVTVG